VPAREKRKKREKPSKFYENVFQSPKKEGAPGLEGKGKRKKGGLTPKTHQALKLFPQIKGRKGEGGKAPQSQEGKKRENKKRTYLIWYGEGKKNFT